MKTRIAAVAMLLVIATPAYAHRLDEYLQATLISVGKDRVRVELRLTPGVAVFPRVLAAIDTNGDGVISDAERRSYVARVLGDVTLAIDGVRLPLRVTASRFASIAEMKEGLGDIEIDVDAVVPRGRTDRTLTFDNHHLSGISVYLANALVPSDTSIRVAHQHRSYDQASFRLGYSQDGVSADPQSLGDGSWSGFGSVVRLGVRHIAEGTDHLLFLLVLLLPAPLLVSGGRWRGNAEVQQSVVRLVRIVTAFTIGHSLTLAAAALGLVHAPSRPIEVLIAVSILVSAVHAFRPIFPGREAFVAGGFGLVHGFAFASMISSSGLDSWHLTLTVFGFNLGIELMQLAVVAATVPWLLLLARTPAYAFVRATGATVAGLAALGWIGERALGLTNPIGPMVEQAASHPISLGATLMVLAVSATAVTGVSRKRASASAL